MRADDRSGVICAGERYAFRNASEPSGGGVTGNKPTITGPGGSGMAAFWYLNG
jgi:hypothetical protein